MADYGRLSCVVAALIAVLLNSMDVFRLYILQTK